MGGRGSYYERKAVKALPDLEGSEKQIEWADRIRQRFIDSYNWSIKHSKKDPLYDKLGLNAGSGIYRLMQEAAISLADIRAGSNYGDEHTSTSWAKSLQIEKMPMFYWDEHDDLTRNMNRYRQDAIDSWVQHTKGESKAHADMMNIREKAINKFYETANKEFTSKIIIMDDDAMDKMNKDQRKAATKSNLDAYYKFLRRYSRKVLKSNTDAGWWIDNFK